jgi:5-formyltetrahydrofolate cyclo-ligase
MTSKMQLRIDLRKNRQNFVKQDNIQKIFDQNALRLDELLTPELIVAAYQKMESEVSAEAILAAANALDVMTALPFIAARGDVMCFKPWQSGELLVKSPYAFLQPAIDAPDVEPDIILVPLVGFDRDMNRIGQGAGPNALRIGLAWSCQECSAIPTDPWDVALDAVLTEKEWIKPAHSRIGR